MLPSTIVRALTTPAFEPEHFTATQWSPAEDKAKFANALMKFFADEFPRPGFTKALYQRLSNTFGHIAHTNRRRVLIPTSLSAPPTSWTSSIRRFVGVATAIRPTHSATSSAPSNGACGPPTRSKCSACARPMRPASASSTSSLACKRNTAPTASLLRPRRRPRRRRPTCSRHDAKNRPRRRQ